MEGVTMSAYEAFASVYDVFMEQVEYDQWLQHIYAVWDKFGLNPKTVIDLGCGTGSIALPLAKEGYDVIGVDLSPEMLTEADHKAMEEGVSGYSVPVKDVELLTKYILDFLRNPEEAERIGQQGRKWVEERFDQKIFIEKYMENRMHIINNSARR
jgi:tRNA/tmRNA/rRNA uracil-C5-methylase (TrmA/RlmC/RlmD family)